MGYSWNAKVESYSTYLSRRAVLDEQLRGASDASARTAREILHGISPQIRDVLGSMDRSTAVLRAEVISGLGHLAGVLRHGFAGLLHSLDRIDRELQRLVELVEFEEQKKAMENFRYAVDCFHRGLWNEALEYVDAAIDGDEHSKGYKIYWRFHWLRGELLLGAPARHDWPGLDAAAAEQAFLLAARYSRTDDPREAARAFLMASVAAHAQTHEKREKLADMLKHAEAACALDDNLAGGFFQTAKAQMALGAPGPALTALRRAIDRDLVFAVRAAEDPDCRRYEEHLQPFFTALRAETAKALAAQARILMAELSPFAARYSELESNEAVARLRRVAAAEVSDRGLVDVLEYRNKGLQADEASCRQAVGGLLQAEIAACQKEMEEVTKFFEACARAERRSKEEGFWKGFWDGRDDAPPTGVCLFIASLGGFWFYVGVKGFGYVALISLWPPIFCGLESRAQRVAALAELSQRMPRLPRMEAARSRLAERLAALQEEKRMMERTHS